jgi:hypothetical protein
MAIVVRRNITPNNFIQFRENAESVEYTLDGLTWLLAFTKPNCEVPEAPDTIGGGGDTIEINMSDVYDIALTKIQYDIDQVFNNTWVSEDGTAQNSTEAQDNRLCNALYVVLAVFNEIMRTVNSDFGTALNSIVGGLADILARELRQTALPVVSQAAFITERLFSDAVMKKWKKDTFNRTDFNPAFYNLTPLTSQQILDIVCDAKDIINASNFTFDDVHDAVGMQLSGGYSAAWSNYFNSNTFAMLIANLWGGKQEDTCVCTDCELYTTVGQFVDPSQLTTTLDAGKTIIPIWQGDQIGAGVKENSMWLLFQPKLLSARIAKVRVKFSVPNGFHTTGEMIVRLLNLAGSTTTHTFTANTEIVDEWVETTFASHSTGTEQLSVRVEFGFYQEFQNGAALMAITGAKISAIEICYQ